MSPAAAVLEAEVPQLPLVLVVDDQPEICHAISLLAGEQYRCVEAFSGDAALQVLNDTDVDVIVSDLQMPGIDGIEFLRRAQSGRPNAARVLISGYSNPDEIIEGINKGHVLFFISRPFKRLAMHAILQQATQHSFLLRDRARLVDELTDLNRELEERVKQRTFEVEFKNFELERTAEKLNLAIPPAPRHQR
jgi:response regulator RpfG family c-di-GMP phosphodiesterase